MKVSGFKCMEIFLKKNPFRSHKRKGFITQTLELVESNVKLSITNTQSLQKRLGRKFVNIVINSFTICYILSTETIGLLLTRIVFKPAFLNKATNHALSFVFFKEIVIA